MSTFAFLWGDAAVLLERYWGQNPQQHSWQHSNLPHDCFAISAATSSPPHSANFGTLPRVGFWNWEGNVQEVWLLFSTAAVGEPHPQPQPPYPLMSAEAKACGQEASKACGREHGLPVTWLWRDMQGFSNLSRLCTKCSFSVWWRKIEEEKEEDMLVEGAVWICLHWNVNETVSEWQAAVPFVH